MLTRLRRILAWTLTIGGISFAAGFFGPMFLYPESNQGPLLGIFYTGPIGVAVGFGIGLLREILGYTATPLDLLRRTGILDLWPPDPTLVRPVAGVVGAALAVYGLMGIQRGEGRGAAAMILIGAALLHHAVTGRRPAWFRR